MSAAGYEVNFDGIVGPTHNYSGLSEGNLASGRHGGESSNPKAAALQGLEKMKFVHDLGIKQAVIPPHYRPATDVLRSLGFTGPDRFLPEKAAKASTKILQMCMSASSMWVANGATFTPSVDSAEGRVQITPANLWTHFHRSMESRFTGILLKKIFPDPVYFRHHEPIPPGVAFLDEGAANHTRFCHRLCNPGVHLYVYGKKGFETSSEENSIYPSRQTKEASEAVARGHAIFEDRVVFAKQNVLAVDAGAFHNDVISVGNGNVFFCHEYAFENQNEVIKEIAAAVKMNCDLSLKLVDVSEKEIPLRVAIKTYLFNSQIVTLEDGTMSILAPIECQENSLVRQYLENLSNNPDVPIHSIHYIDLRQSMYNGGGPGCLRIRVVLNPKEYSAVLPEVMFGNRLYDRLVLWVNKHYRDTLKSEDLIDPHLVDESQAALDELTKILNLGKIYPFQ